jgi:hypothetical protein
MTGGKHVMGYYLSDNHKMIFLKSIGRYDLKDMLIMNVELLEDDTIHMYDDKKFISATGKDAKEIVEQLESAFEYFIFGSHIVFKKIISGEDFDTVINIYSGLNEGLPYLTQKAFKTSKFKKYDNQLITQWDDLFTQMMNKYNIPNGNTFDAYLDLSHGFHFMLKKVEP